jgi:hypothetical protein
MLRSLEDRLKLRIDAQQQTLDVVIVSRHDGRDCLTVLSDNNGRLAARLNEWAQRGDFRQFN